MKEIFKWFQADENSSEPEVRVSWFSENFEIGNFKGIEKLMYLFIEYCADLGVPVKKQYFDTFLITECTQNVKKYNIRLDTMDAFNYEDPAALGEAVKVIRAAALNLFDTFMEVDLNDHTFKVDMKSFMTRKKSEKVQEILTIAYPQIVNGSDVDDAVENMQAELDRTVSAYDPNKLADLDFMTGRENASDMHRARFLFKTNIPCIDGDTGGIFSKQVINLTANPGSGKTRMAMANFVYQAAVVHKQSVLVDELEMSKEEIENILIAYHIINLYGGKIKIPDVLINKGRLNEEQKRFVEAARIDLFESGKYGKIFIRDKGLILERLQKDVTNFLKNNKDVSVWVVDYIGLIGSKPTEKFSKNLQGYEIIQESFKYAKSLAKSADIAVITLSQFSDEGIKAAQAGKKIRPGMVQGGHIVQRHTDYDLALCMTDEQEAANMRTLSTVKVRGARGFQNVPFNVDLSVSIFRQLKSEASV